jgi:hypothetical protein
MESNNNTSTRAAAVLAVSLVLGASILIAPAIQLAAAAPDNRRGRDPLDGQGNLIGVHHLCGDNVFDKWRNPDGTLRDTVTYKVVDQVGVSSAILQAVKAGIEEWDGFVYNIQEVDSTDNADITVKILNKVAFDTGNRHNQGVAYGECDGEHKLWAAIELAAKGSLMKHKIGAQNLAAHEFGHTLGLGPRHATTEADLMNGGSDNFAKSWLKRVICPSNLDVGGLTAEVSPYSVEVWKELDC